MTNPNASAWRRLKRWFKSTSKRTFVVYPIGIAAFEFGLHRGAPDFHPLGVILLAWGYLQYRLSGKYRTRLGGGGPGIEIPPDEIVASGPYRWVRNPMYLGHLIFMLGLVVTFSSIAAALLLVVHVFWFHRRVLADEKRLETRFGAPYLGYKARVKRWIPGVL